MAVNEGFKHFEQRLAGFRQALHDLGHEKGTMAIGKLFERTAWRVAEEIRGPWPVDTGYSRKRWTATKVEPLEWKVENDAGYVPYVYAKGDRSRTPIVPKRFASALDKVYPEFIAQLRDTLSKMIHRRG